MQRMVWEGDVPPQKWMNLYTKLMSPYVFGGGLTVRVRVEIAPEGGLSQQKVEEAISALRELGLDDDVCIDGVA
jgi:hypothetical protein